MSHAQSFIFIKDPSSFIIDTSKVDTNNEIRDSELYTFNLLNYNMSFSGMHELTAKDHRNRSSSVQLDFGSGYFVYNFGYLENSGKLYILYFIYENGKYYTVLDTYKLKNLEKYKRICFEDSFYLLSSQLLNDALTLKYINKTYEINLLQNNSHGSGCNYN